MKLSESMRLGAMLKPQAFGWARAWLRTGFLRLFGPKVEHSCALQAMYDGSGLVAEKDITGSAGISVRGSSADSPGVIVPTEWFTLLSATEECPACGTWDATARIIAEHLNDKHRWSRERIADWVATLESRQESMRQRAQRAAETFVAQETPTHSS